MENHNTFVLVSPLPKDNGKIYQLSTGFNHNIIIYENEQIYGCGLNENNQLSI